MHCYTHWSVKSPVKYQHLFNQSSVWLATVLRVILSILVMLLTAALVVGVIKSGVDLLHNLRSPLETILQNLLLDAVFILAVTEIIITALGYLRDGQVHVRYIVDTILIIMLNEIVSMWFKHPGLQNAIALSVIVATLAAIRVSVTRFAPRRD